MLGKNASRVLKFIGNMEKTYAYEISKELGLHYSTVHYHLSKLHRESFIEKVKRNDTVIYCVTEKGKKLLEILENRKRDV